MDAWRTFNPATGTESYLDEGNWRRHLAKRPLLQSHLLSVKEVVSDPDFAFEDEEGIIYKYKFGLARGRAERLWLKVIEGPEPSGAHHVRTMYFTADLPEGYPFYLQDIPIGRG